MTLENSERPLLCMTGICKRFPGVRALEEMQIEVRGGEVHAVVGENGAGKSTLMHILAGVYQPEAGRIDFAGQADVRIADERAAQRMGIAIVYQERSLFESLTVAENIFAGRQPVRFGNWIDRRRMEQDAFRLLAQVGLACSPSTPLDQLSPAEQQLVEIAKALSLNARLIIFDEPTAALTEGETRTLFGVIRDLKTAGTAIIYISHRLEEIIALADRVTVLKDGRWQGTLAVAETTAGELVRRMVGRELLRTERKGRQGDKVTRRKLLEVKSLSDARKHRSRDALLENVSFHVNEGEVVLLAGLSGAGRTEAAMSVFGARSFGAGTVFIDGREARIHSVADAIGAGIGYLPEDRKQAGLFLEMSIAHNVAAAGLKRFGRVVTSDRAVAEAAESYRGRLGIACRSVHQSVRTLSGGNQQKVLLAKWLLVEPQVLIVDEPTRGVDVGAKAEVHRLLFELAERGTAVLVISSDLPEVLTLGDRVIVMAQGRVSGELSRAEASEEAIIHLASQSAAA